ncbi:hypothetical protein PoB_002467000 [Plakobranchus ocellatus]|uniref:Uncharacterized protein n=1 Tax=Plakobranchus ocellatus TaxID=259542 RepID=A0AAV3ZR09_9GAST|nr:hypothetical protein PoB_002467000 [Plakobranchus ocellatus]
MSTTLAEVKVIVTLNDDVIKHFLEQRANYHKPDKITSRSTNKCDLRLSGPPSGQGVGGGARDRDRRIPADFRADSLSSVPPTPQPQRKK